MLPAYAHGLLLVSAFPNFLGDSGCACSCTRSNSNELQDILGLLVHCSHVALSSDSPVLPGGRLPGIPIFRCTSKMSRPSSTTAFSEELLVNTFTSQDVTYMLEDAVSCCCGQRDTGFGQAVTDTDLGRSVEIVQATERRYLCSH